MPRHDAKRADSEARHRAEPFREESVVDREPIRVQRSDTPEPRAYGLTAITLGDVLKGQLDEVARASGGNRSRIIREALERYFDQLPQIQKQRKEQRQRIRELAFLIVLHRVLRSCKAVLESFDYGEDTVPVELQGSLTDLVRQYRDWADSRIPSDWPTRVRVPELEEPLSDFEVACRRLWIAMAGQKWNDIVQRWQEAYKNESAATTGENTSAQI